MFQDKGMQLFSLILQQKQGVEIHEEGENLHWCAKNLAWTQNLNSTSFQRKTQVDRDIPIPISQVCQVILNSSQNILKSGQIMTKLAEKSIGTLRLSLNSLK